MKITTFLHFVAFFAKPVPKIHKIRSHDDDMRKILSQKYRSLGTPLGSLGPGSQKGLPEIFSNVVFLHDWDPNEAPEKVSYPLLSKKLVALRKRCGEGLKVKLVQVQTY